MKLLQYYSIGPEVAGAFGENTIITRPDGRMVVEKLHYEFQGWLGDPILESVPSYIVTTHLATDMTEGKLMGFTFEDVEVSTSEDFYLLHPNTVLPKFVWLKLNGGRQS